MSIFSVTRIAILDAVRAKPGCSYSDVARAIVRHPSVVYDNARRLQRAGLLIVEPNGRSVALFATGDLTPEQRVEARLGDSYRVLKLVRQGTTSPALIAYELGTSRHAVRHHLERLVALGLVRAVETRVLVSRRAFLAT